MIGGPEPDPDMQTGGPVPQPRRILMTLDAVGGVWQYAMGLAAQLARSGTTIFFAGVGPLPSADQREEAETIGTVEWLKTPPDWLAQDEHALDGLSDELAYMVHKHGVELVHLNAPTQAASLALPCPVVAVSHSCVVTWFHTVRGAIPQDDDWAWHKPCNQAGFDRADVVVAPSGSHAAALEACYGPISRLRVVHNAVSPSGIEARRENIV